MVHSLDYTTISHVLDSWERARRLTTNFEQEVGVILFQQYVTAACPNRARQISLVSLYLCPLRFLSQTVQERSSMQGLVRLSPGH
mmetsp:Transcript_15753/g.43459  ORF Transcript_15753/g.43459 Transcript_15753/m.43459 type:complete len:85 (-) Transcript_15753:384-638(-)